MFHLIKDGDISFGWNIVVEFDGGFKFGNIRWFSNISDYYPPPFEFKRQYREEDFRKFDNYDAIYIKKSEDIPDEYYGVMGVPVSFIDKWDYRQFDIVDARNYRKDDVFSDMKVQLLCGSGGELSAIKGEKKFSRILIKRRFNKNF